MTHCYQTRFRNDACTSYASTRTSVHCHRQVKHAHHLSHRERKSLRRLICHSSVSSPARVVQQIQEKEALRPLPRDLEGSADDATLHNPLKRMQRLGTNWFGVIMEYEGVLVADTSDIHMRAWLQVAEQLKLQRPLGQLFRRIRSMRNETVVMTVFNWTRNPAVAKDISKTKEDIYDELLGNTVLPEMLGGRSFLETMKMYNIPLAIACALPASRVQQGLNRLQLEGFFDAVITAEDNGSPEIELSYMIASQQIDRPGCRCVVVGDSNNSVEAAHELGMKCVIVTGGKPAYNYVNADLVVPNLSHLSFMNMKRLFGNEDLVQPRAEFPEDTASDYGSMDSNMSDTDFY